MTNQVRIERWMRAAEMCSKISLLIRLGTTTRVGSFWENNDMTHFGAVCGPKLAHFQGPFGLERRRSCSTWAENGLISIACAPVIVQKYFWNNPFLIHF